MGNNRDRTNGWQTGQIQAMQQTCKETRMTFAGALNGLSAKIDKLHAKLDAHNAAWFERLNAVNREVGEIQGRAKVNALIVTMIASPVLTVLTTLIAKRFLGGN